MALSDKELERIADQLLKKLGGGLASSSLGTRRSYSGRKSRYDDDEVDVSEVNKLIANLSRSLKKTKESFDSVESMNKILMQEGKALQKNTEAYSDFMALLNYRISQLPDTMRDLEEGASEAESNLWKFASSINTNTTASKNFSSSLAKSIVNSAAFGSALMNNSNMIKQNTRVYDSVTKDLKAAAGQLNAGILKTANVYDKFTGSIKSSLSPEDYARLNLSVANVTGIMNDTAEKLKLKNGLKDLAGLSLAELGDAASADENGVKAGLKMMVDRLQAAGVSFEDITGEVEFSQLSIEQLSAVVKRAAEMQEHNTYVLEEFNDVAKATSTQLGVMLTKIENASDSIRDWTDANIMSTDAIQENMGKFGDAINRIYEQATDFNISMLPDTFAEVQRKAIEMGMSFEETVEFLQANKRLYSVYGGAGQFEAANDMIMASYKGAGFNQKQAAQMLANDVALATSSGVDIKDPGNLSKFIEETASSFKRLSSVVGMTHAEYTEALTSINASTEMSAALVGLDEQQAEALRRSNAAQYENYRLLGLSNEEAQETIRAAARRNREGIAAKFASMARETMLASQVGMDPAKVREIQQLGSMSYLNPEQQARLAELRRELGVQTEQARMQAGESGDQARHAMITEMANRLEADMMEDARSQMSTGVTAELAARSGINVDSAQAAATAAAANPNQTVTELSDWVNSFKAIMDNSFVAALFSGTAAVIGLALSAGKAALALNRIGGGGGLTDMLGRRGRPGRGPRSPTPMGSRGANRPATGPGSREDVLARRAMGREGRIAAGTNTNVAGGVGRGLTLGRAARAARGGLAGAAATIGGGMLIDHLASSGTISEETAQTANAGMDIAGMAATGAMLGSVVPGIGTAIGGVAGGVLGTAMNWDTGGKDLVQGLMKYGTPMGWAAAAGEHTAGLTDSIFGTNTQDTLGSINERIFGSRFTEPEAAAATAATVAAGVQDQLTPAAAVNSNVTPLLGPGGLSPAMLEALQQILSPEKMGEAFAKALAGQRITLYNPSSATTAIGHITGRLPNFQG